MEAAERSLMDCTDDDTRGLLSVLFRFTPELVLYAASPKRLSLAKVIAANFGVNRMAS
jgi:hypothetical protein